MISGLTFRDRPAGVTAYKEPRFEGSEPLDVPSAPAVPVIRKLFVIPESDDLVLEVDAGEPSITNDIRVRPYPEYRRDGTGGFEEVVAEDASIYQSDSDFPGEIARIHNIGYLRGQRLALVEFCPVQYNPVRGEVKTYNDFHVTLRPQNPQGELAVNVGPMQNALRAAAANYPAGGPALASGGGMSGPNMSASGQVCRCTGGDWQATANAVIACAADYLIIVAEEIASSDLVDSLAQRRADYNGFNVAIASMEYIDDDPDTLVTPATIWNFLKTIYDSGSAAHMGDSLLGYVLLLGDAFNPGRDELIPSYYGYGTGAHPKLDLEGASDAYYSFLDPGDPATDRYPDLFLGRLSVDYDDQYWELENVVRKIIDYEPLPAATWVDAALVVSGLSAKDFTFEYEGLSGFQGFFDSVFTYYPPPGKSVVQMHRLQYPQQQSYHDTLATKLAAAINSGKWLTAFFDHGFTYSWDGSFYPQYYDSLQNVDKSTIVLSIGSHTTQFDWTYDTAVTIPGQPPSCCTGAHWGSSNLGCYSSESPPVDSCDVLSERLLVQEYGAIGIIGYSRSQSPAPAQRDFIDFFRALSRQSPGTLGELLVGMRLLAVSNNISARNLTLLGDPALNIHWQGFAQSDTVDLVVADDDIVSPIGGAFLDADAPSVDARVRNSWRNDAASVKLMLWRGVPGGEGSTKLDSLILDLVPAYGDTLVRFDLAPLPHGDIELFVVVDPDDVLAERSEENNVASSRFAAFGYEGNYPVKLGVKPADGGKHSITIADVHPNPGKEILVVSGDYAEQKLFCFPALDTVPLWTFPDQGTAQFVSTPLVGYLDKTDAVTVLAEVGDPSTVFRIEGSSGVATEAFQPGQTYSAPQLRSSKRQRCLLTDLDADDDGLEGVYLSFRDEAFIDTLLICGFRTSAGERLFNEAVDFLNNPMTAIAVADIDRDGRKEVLVLLSHATGGANDKELTIYEYTDGSLTRQQQVDLGSTSSASREIPVSMALIDRDDDAQMEILCSVKRSIGGSFIRLLDSAGDPLWDASVSDTLYFSVGDLDNDASPDIVVAESGRLRVLSSAGSQVRARTMLGYPLGPPYLVDVDGDGDLEIVTWFETKDNGYFPRIEHQSTLVVSDNTLEPIERYTLTQPAAADGNAAIPAIDDIDGDGVLELAILTPDQFLRVFEIGSQAGDLAWPQRFCNPSHTNAPEQPLLGSYVNPVSVLGPARMLGDVTLDSLAAPSLFFGAGATVRVDTVSSGEGYLLRAYGKVTVAGAANEPVRFFTEVPATSIPTWRGLFIDDWNLGGGESDTLSHVEIHDADIGIETHSALDLENMVVTNTFNTGIYALADCSLENSTVTSSDGRGLYFGYGVDAVISATTVTGHASTGLDFAGGVLVVSSGSAISDNGLHGIHLMDDHLGSSITETTIHDNYAAGIRCETSSPEISSCSIKNCDIGIACLYESDASISSSEISGHRLGVFAFDSFPFLGHEENYGYNCIMNNTSYHVANYSGGTIYAEGNQWAPNWKKCCPTAKFYGDVACSVCAESCTGGEAAAAAPQTVETAKQLPVSFDIGVGVPNPFNPVTSIPYAVPPPGGHVRMTVYNVRGQKVIDLVDRFVEPGYHRLTWTGVSAHGGTVASGVYFIRMTAGQFHKTVKAVVLK